MWGSEEILRGKGEIIECDDGNAKYQRKLRFHILGGIGKVDYELLWVRF
jgi:hypothetical protein